MISLFELMIILILVVGLILIIYSLYKIRIVLLGFLKIAKDIRKLSMVDADPETDNFGEKLLTNLYALIQVIVGHRHYEIFRPDKEEGWKKVSQDRGVNRG